ncbi:hypothetical protein OAP04_04015 [Pelagibacteraceae bacterium]|nr:hypothetical protein [Pelagibacteraceae bacterium]
MKKFLTIIFLSFFFFSNLYANCSNEIDFNWSHDNYTANFEFKSRSNKTIYITKMTINTSDGGVMKTITRYQNKGGGTSRFVESISAYGADSFKTSIANLNTDLIANASWWCNYNLPESETKLDFSKFNKKKNKSWFKWWYIPIAIVIIGFISSALDTSKTSRNTKTRKTSSSLAEGENFIFDVFEGKKPLGQTFWLAFILVNIIVSFISALLAENYDNNFLLIGAAASNIWAGVGTWNSATNYQLENIKKKQPYGWAYGAKILVVLNFIIFSGQLILLINS